MNNRDANSTNRRTILLGAGDAPMALRIAAERMTRAACHVPADARQATHQAAADLEVLARDVAELIDKAEAVLAGRRMHLNGQDEVSADWIGLAAALAALQPTTDL